MRKNVLPVSGADENEVLLKTPVIQDFGARKSNCLTVETVHRGFGVGRSEV